MTRLRPALRASLACCALSACATGALLSGDWLEVREQPVGARNFHERCATMQPGDRIEFRYSANQPLAFNIHYHEGKVVIAPVTREAAVTGEGAFEPLSAQEYCLTWEAGPVDTLLQYRVRRVKRGPR
jgi:hypothetical protein